MKRFLTKILITSASFFTLLLVTIIVAVTLIITTESGTQFAWQRTQTFLPETVDIDSLSGKLAGPLVLSGLKVSTEALDLELDMLEFDWLPSLLFKKVLEIDRIAVTGLRYTQLDTSKPEVDKDGQPFKLPESIDLPIEVRLNMVSVNDFRYRSNKDAVPTIINLAQLIATAGQQQIELTKLHVTSTLFSLNGNASLTTAQNYPVNGELHWQLPVPEYPSINGSTRFSGNINNLAIHQTIAKPYGVKAEVLLKHILDNLSFEATVDANPLKLHDLNKDLPPMTIELSASASGVPDNIALSLNGWVEDQTFGRFNLETAGGFAQNRLQIDDLTVTVPEQPALLGANGQVNLNGTPDLNVQVNWQQLQWPLKGDPLITSPDGEMKLTGTVENLHAALDIAVGDNGHISGSADRQNRGINISLDWRDLQWPLTNPEVKSSKGHITVSGQLDEYSLDIEAGVDVPDQTGAQLIIQGQGTQEALNLSRIDIEALEGTLKGTADLRWHPELQGAVDLIGQGLNPGVLLKEWPGNISIQLQAQGGMQNQEPHLQLQQLHAQGQLRGYSLSLDGEGSYKKDLTVLKRLTLSSGSTRFEAGGTISDTLNVNWQLHSADLNTLLPEAKGKIDGRGILSGPVKRPHLTTDLHAEDLEYTDYKLKLLDLDADIDSAGEKQSQISLLIEQGIVSGVELNSIALNGSGNSDSHALSLKADTTKGQADIDLQGQLHAPWQPESNWDFKLNTLNLKYPELDGWELQSPATGHVSSDTIRISTSCLQSNEALLCLKGNRSTDGIDGDFTLTELPFSYLAAYLPDDIAIHGSLSGKGTLHKPKDKEPAVSIDLNTSEVRLLATDPDEEELNERLILAFQPGDITLKMQQEGINASVNLPISKNDSISMQAAIAPDQQPLPERSLQGKVDANIENLDFIADLIPEVQNLNGRLNGNMEITGSLGSPVLKGRLALAEGAAQLEGPGLNLHDIQLNLSGEGDGGLKLTAHALSEEGHLNIDGTADLRGKATTADIKVIGENFRVLNTQEAEVDTSPDLTISIREQRVDVDGKIVIPLARINLKTLPESAVKVSDDQLIASSDDQENSTQKKGRDLHARVRLVLGDEVRFEGLGLKARIQGNILAVEKPGEPTTGSGELEVLDGEYRAYGQGLVIEKGRLLFAGGPIHKPGLDVRAVRRPKEGITVGVLARGNLDQPDFTLFSDPSMTQGNQLSYLVLGRPMSGSSGDEEGSALSRAALALGLKGGSSVAAKINSKLGFDQFGLASTEAGAGSNPQNASFVIGKYLSPKLYVSYGLGLFEPVSTLRLQYAISSKWEFVTESSSTASGGDVIYTIETGN